MARAVGVDVVRLREGAKALKGAAHGRRPSADGPAGFGSYIACGAVNRFEEYWVPGHSAVDEVLTALADALSAAADTYEQRDAADAGGFRADRGGFHGF